MRRAETDSKILAASTLEQKRVDQKMPSADANGEGHAGRARRLEKAGNLEEAASAYNAALEKNDSRAEWHYRLGYVLEKMKKFEAAALAYQAALARDDRKAEWYFRLGKVFAALTCWGEAVSAYQAALARDDSKAEWHFRLGRALEKMKNRQQAASAYAAALGRDGSKGAWHFRLATLLEWEAGARDHQKVIFDDEFGARSAQLDTTSSGDVGWKEVEDAYTTALRLRPEDDLCRYRLARCLALRGQHSDAVRILKPIETENDKILMAVLSSLDKTPVLTNCTNLFVQGTATRSARKIELNYGTVNVRYFEHSTTKQSVGERICAFYEYVSSKFKKSIPNFIPMLHHCVIRDDFNYFLYDYIDQSHDVARLLVTDATTARALTTRVVQALADLQKRFDDFDPQTSVAPRLTKHLCASDLEIFVDKQFQGGNIDPDDFAIGRLFNKKIDAYLDDIRCLPKVFSHADAHTDNVLVSDEGNIYIIDWDGYGYAPVGFDLVTFFEDGLDTKTFNDAVNYYFDLISYNANTNIRKYIIALVIILYSTINDRPLRPNWFDIAVRNGR